jgi:hypothetical protein
MGTLIQLQAAGASVTVVNTYSDLPVPSSFSGKFFWVSNSQGTSWLPGALGGTYYPKGLYYSNGSTWEYVETPYQATQSEVDLGIVSDKFVSPETFENAEKWKLATFTIDLLDVLTIDVVAPYDLKINNGTVISGTGTVTLLVNALPYTFTTLIQQGETITITVDTASVVNLDVRYE